MISSTTRLIAERLSQFVVASTTLVGLSAVAALGVVAGDNSTFNNSSSSNSSQTELTYRSALRSISSNSYITGIVLIVLTLALLFLFIVVLFHYRLARVLPHDDQQQQQQQQSRMGTSQSSASKKHSPSMMMAMKNRDHSEQIEMSGHQINAISAGVRMIDEKKREDEPVMFTHLSNTTVESVAAVYTSIDNTSELESIQDDREDDVITSSSSSYDNNDDDDDDLNIQLDLYSLTNGVTCFSKKKERSYSCENFVLIQNVGGNSNKLTTMDYDDPILILNVMKVDNVEKSYL